MANTCIQWISNANSNSTSVSIGPVQYRAIDRIAIERYTAIPVWGQLIAVITNNRHSCEQLSSLLSVYSSFAFLLLSPPSLFLSTIATNGSLNKTTLTHINTNIVGIDININTSTRNLQSFRPLAASFEAAPCLSWPKARLWIGASWFKTPLLPLLLLESCCFCCLSAPVEAL